MKCFAGLVLMTALVPLSATAATVTVQSGETLSEIADRYGVSTRQLVRLNGLRNANHVEVGQTLKLPSNAVIAQAKPKPAPIQVTSGASEHTVGRGQTLTQIARAYQLPVATLIDINAISDPNKVTVGTRLYLKSPEQPLASSGPSNSTTPNTTLPTSTT